VNDKLASGAKKAIGFDGREIVEWIKDAVIEFGLENIDAIETAAKSAIDVFVAIDIPWLPAFAELWFDGLMRKVLYGAVEKAIAELKSL